MDAQCNPSSKVGQRLADLVRTQCQWDFGEAAGSPGAEDKLRHRALGICHTRPNKSRVRIIAARANHFGLMQV